jgi:osmotically-inducible protein OsmY
MIPFKPYLCLLALLAVGGMAGCSASSTKAVDVSDSVHTSLVQAGFKDITVSQDRDQGVVTLSGHVATEGEKSQAETIAKSLAVGQVVANQIAVVPPGGESDAKAVNLDLDNGIANNLDAALLSAKLHDGVSYAVKNQVVTLSGDVDSQAKRGRVEQIAAVVPNVRQVVNELQVQSQKATSSN